MAFYQNDYHQNRVYWEKTRLLITNFPQSRTKQNPTFTAQQTDIECIINLRLHVTQTDCIHKHLFSLQMSKSYFMGLSVLVMEARMPALVTQVPMILI